MYPSDRNVPKNQNIKGGKIMFDKLLLCCSSLLTSGAWGQALWGVGVVEIADAKSVSIIPGNRFGIN